MGNTKMKHEKKPGEFSRIRKIAKRAIVLAEANGIAYDYLDALMDIEACHTNGCPLKLDALLAADDFNFSHDILGIRRYLDRDTGRLTNHFLPRFAA